MNFLEIAKETNTFSGLQGDIDTVVNPTGLQKVLLKFINAAYNNIQLMRDSWAWMNTHYQFSWNPSTVEYTNTAIDKYVTISYDDYLLKYYSYDYWKLNKFDTKLDPSKPECFTIKPETNGIIINPPDDYYNIDVRAVIVPEELTSNLQVPLLPERFHRILAYKAAIDMGMYLGNAEIISANTARYDTMIGQLLRSQNLPKRIKRRPIV